MKKVSILLWLIVLLLSGCSSTQEKTVPRDIHTIIEIDEIQDAIPFSLESIDSDYVYEQFVCEKIGQQIASMDEISSATVELVPNEETNVRGVFLRIVFEKGVYDDEILSSIIRYVANVFKIKENCIFYEISEI